MVATATKPVAKIAIIGAGVGGAATYHFLQQEAESLHAHYTVDITVFDQSSRIGGRAEHVLFSSSSEDTTTEEFAVEAGGSLLHDSNLYMTEFAKLLGLQKQRLKKDGGVAIWDGSRVVWSSVGFASSARMYWRFGPLNLKNVAEKAAGMVSKFTELYIVQRQQQQAFKTVGGLLSSVGLAGYTTVSLQESLQTLGTNHHLRNEFATGIMRANYGQDTRLNALAGYVALVTDTDALWRVKGGNSKVPEGLLKDATVHLNTAITRIQQQYTAQGKAFFTLSDQYKQKHEFDMVIVAAPLELAGIVIQYGRDPVSASTHRRVKPSTVRKFQKTHVALVQGDLRMEYFGWNSKHSVADTVMTTEDKRIPFNSVAKVQDNVYKMNSRQEVSEEFIRKELFANVSRLERFEWDAYPKYNPPEELDSFQISNHLYNLNVLETAASAFEIACVGAKNVALLVEQTLVEEFTAAAAAAAALPAVTAGHDEL
jgi:prenylcysteine oxidase/farnesylcysteine lyase